MRSPVELLEYFKNIVRTNPLASAVITNDSVLTYSDLNDSANALASALKSSGITAQEAIGVLVERSASLPTAFLAILKAGGVYVPMVADLPVIRLANMAQQANISRLIVLDGIEVPEGLVSILKSNGGIGSSSVIIRPETLPTQRQAVVCADSPAGEAADLAAILFTSGSTGVPKGVMIRHDSCVNLVLGHIAAHGIGSEDRLLLSASPGFILGFRELCLPFMSGAATVPVSRSTIDNPAQLLTLMSRHRVSIAMFTPSYLRLLNGVVPQGLRCIITSGERPNATDARHYAKHVEYWNVHGATEVCGTICMHRVNHAEEGPIPSGRPFVNTSVYLLDETGHEVQQGEVGELHVVSVGVSSGYLQQPELTSQSFIETRYGRAYRTRDLGRWNANGDLETVGRADDVVKISGQSVSLSEIELTLLRHPRVRRSAAMQVKGILVACVECPDLESTRKIDWRQFLGKSLPSYMIPAQVAILASMPINSSGKVDRKALFDFSASIFEESGKLDDGDLPSSDLEVAMARVWEDVIGTKPIMRDHNFYTIGGTSLMAIEISQHLQSLGHKVTVQMILTKLTVAALADRINELREVSPSENDDVLIENAATTDQLGFWVASELKLASASAHITRVLEVCSHQPQPHDWQSAWENLLERHPALRSSFYSDGSTLRWQTLEPAELTSEALFSFHECATLEAAGQFVQQRTDEPFQLMTPPLVRAGLITVTGESKQLLWFILHHSVVDGLSAQIFQEDLLTLVGGRSLLPAPHGLALASYSEQQYLTSPQMIRDRDFWRDKLDHLVACKSCAFDEYVTDHSRPALPSGQGWPTLTEKLDRKTVSALGRLAKKHGSGLHALLLLLLATETRRRAGLSDIIIGNGISLRPAGGETAIGHFVNLMPVILVHDAAPISVLLRRVQLSLTETVEHASYPAAHLTHEFLQRHPGLRSSTSLFDIALTAVPPRTSVVKEIGVSLRPQSLPGTAELPAAGLDLVFSHEPSPEDGGLNLLLTWNADVCSPDNAKAWLSAFADWARWLAADSARCEQAFPVLLPHEEKLLKQWEHGASIPRPRHSSQQLFEELADQSPQHLAISGQGQKETLAELDAQANGVAWQLIRQGLVRGDTVAVLTSGSASLPAAVLGIWKAGGVYLPLDHELPAARLTAMAGDAGARVLLVLDRLTSPVALSAAITTMIHFDECAASEQRPNAEGCPDDVAYIIYTSGTTGLPKGVPITHATYINYILGVADAVGFQSDDHMALVASVGFDASLWELGHGLLNGVTLVPISHALRDDPWQLKKYYQEQGVTVAFHTPSYLRISEHVPFEGLRHLFTGGEAPTHRDLRYHSGKSTFWNFYGPTEATIAVSARRYGRDHSVVGPISIGRPFPNVQISLRGEDGTQVPPGAKGELWLGGSALTPGYLNRPELNAESFVTTQGCRFYRSGDYGRWNADGQLELSGRIDQQVKLNGQRVELGEIEQTLCSHPAIAEAVLLADELASEVKILRAYVRCRGDALAEATLQSFLAERLPSHMVPAEITQLAAIPLTPAGKVDHRALLEISERQQQARTAEAPRDPMEMRVAAVWSDLLGVPVARDDNFFALGGNSLLAVALAHQVSDILKQKIAARTLFAAPTLSAYVNAIKNEPTKEQLDTADFENDYASVGELEFWTAEKTGLDTRTFTIPAQFRVIDAVPHEHWQQSWSTLVERHQSLRTRFEEDESGQLRICIEPAVAVTVESALVPDQNAALAYIRQQQAKPLSMATAPMWRVGILSSEEDDQQSFWLALHHAIGDGQSVGTLIDELTTLLAAGELPPEAASPRLFAAREQAYLASQDAIEDERYWSDLLQGTPLAAFAEWPLDKARSANAPSGNHRFTVALDPQTHAGLQQLVRNSESTMHALMLTLLAFEGQRRTGRDDLLIGTAASLRESFDDTRMVGYSVNMLPLHLKPVASLEFAELLQATQKHLAEALQHARFPFTRIYRAFWNEHPELRHPQRYPLFEIAVTENPGSGNSAFLSRFKRAVQASDSVSYECTEASPGQDIVLIHSPTADGTLEMQMHFNAAVYSVATARNWFDSLIGWARWLSEDPTRAYHDLPRLLPFEEPRLRAWQQGEIVKRPDLCFHELFESITDRPGQAERPALISRTGTLSYRALDQEANAIAHALLECQVACGDVVAVLCGRSAQLPATVLGIWKVGAIYLPLASDLPPVRLAFMAQDAGVSHLIALDGVKVPGALADRLPGILRPEELSAQFRQEQSHRPEITCKPNATAYILYTSGSTGEPKGTLIDHDSYVNLALGAAESYELTSDDRCLMFASPSFDVSLSDIGVPLVCGAAICCVDHDIIESPQRLLDFLYDQKITLADITPTYLRLLEGCKLPETLRILVTGGEPPTLADVIRYAPKLSYFNAYGPTENCITSCMGRLTGDEQGLLPAGKPLPNTSLSICDQQGNLLPPGVTGEIWLGGVGLSRGYLNRPEQTVASFLEGSQGRRYRSGDLGRWNADGELVIVGRCDEQVKLNGVRIELGEIEHVLASHPAISQAIALLVEQEQGGKSLWAFVRLLPDQTMPPDDDWRAFLAYRLPSLMIPSGVIPLPELPLSASGKVDRKALSAMVLERNATSGLTLPLDDLEKSVALVWSSVLGQRTIHREDNFFALGGHSLLAINVAHRLEKSLKREVYARELFQEPTLSGFSERLRIIHEPRSDTDVESNLATTGQAEFWTAEQAGLETRGFNIPLALVVHGDIPADEQWQASWASLVSRHDALRTGFYQDDDDVLRRMIVPLPEAAFEIWTADSRSEAEGAIRTRQQESFSMRTPGLWRAGLVRVEEGEALFWFVMHHAVGDGLSLGILVGELKNLLRGKTATAPSFSFNQAAAREAAYLAGQTARNDALYWRKKIDRLIESAPDALEEWPLDKPRPRTRSTEATKGSHFLRCHLSAKVVQSLRALAQRNEASFHALMLALLGHEVRRRTGRSGFLLGTAASTRQVAAEAQTIGYFINMLPLACHLSDMPSFDAQVQAMQQEVAEAIQHSLYPFARIYGDFRQEHPQAIEPGRYPLFDIAVTENPPIHKSSDGAFELKGVAALEIDEISYELRQSAPAQDLLLIHEQQSDGSLILSWFANAEIYSRGTAQIWLDALVGWMRFLSETPLAKGEVLPQLLLAEQQQLIKWQKGPDRALPEKSFPDLFQRLARQQPDRPALITADSVKSFFDVNAGADLLAQTLLSFGMKHGDVVAVLTERSAALPEAVLGIWKAGGCYLPLTADLPVERLAFMAKDAGTCILIALDGLVIPPELEAQNYPLVRPEQLTQNSSNAQMPSLTPDDLAYIIYTSGSSGVPKGVVLRHAGLLNLGLGVIEKLGIGPEDRALCIASPSFDLWISDLVAIWSAGGALVPVNREQLNEIPAMLTMMERLGVTVATMAPSYLRLFEQADFPGLRVLMTAGEAPIVDDARYYAARLAYFNGYGPTENTAATTLCRVDCNSEIIAAGQPLDNMRVYIVDGNGDPVPPGVVGEVWLEGIGLAVGYLNRPELTTTSFVTRNGERCYRTGDLGRWLHSGELQILGRSDTQVKLRGQRVELGEIEHHLASYPGVRQAVAIVEKLTDNTQILRAFVAMESQVVEPSQADWGAFLSSNLPTYMIPSSIHKVADIPLTAAGKVDRRALIGMTSPGDNASAVRQPSVIPHRNSPEQRIAQVWGEVLGSSEVSCRDDFFVLGGDSLKAIAMIGKLRREFDCQVNDLYEHPKLADFSLVCLPRSENLRQVIEQAGVLYQDSCAAKVSTESERKEALRTARSLYASRVHAILEGDLQTRSTYRHVFLTGATGYLGSYLLREFLNDHALMVTVLVRGSDERSARTRLGGVLAGYFGVTAGNALCGNPRLRIMAGDLRQERLQLSSRNYIVLAESVDAIYHCAANTKHVGHYADFYADNVEATRHLLSLAAQCKPVPADFHLVSTLSVSGSHSLDSYRLFTEYDAPPQRPDDNYYIRTKQQAERLVTSARTELPNASIYRTGNIGIATDSTNLQRNIHENAFFKQLVAFLQLGAIPEELYTSICNVDLVARAIVVLSTTKTLVNETHHIETSRRDSLADFVRTSDVVQTNSIEACDFSSFLERLREVVNRPELESALTETVETFGLQSSQSMVARIQSQSLTSDRTQALLARLGLNWPALSLAGQQAVIQAAMEIGRIKTSDAFLTLKSIGKIISDEISQPDPHDHIIPRSLQHGLSAPTE